MIILTSDGLSSSNLIDRVKKVIENKQFKRAYIIVTADNEYKHMNWHLSRLKNELEQCQLEVFLFDFDTDENYLLDEADVILINGGNPFYLLDRMRKNNMKDYLTTFIESGKLLIGMSAGSFVLQKNINLVNMYSKEMNIVGLNDLDAMDLVEIEILPHYSRYITKFLNFEEICEQYEKDNLLSVLRLDDGDGVIVSGDEVEVIRKMQ